MKKCLDCNLTVETTAGNCVLCGSPLRDDGKDIYTNKFPADDVRPEKRKKFSFIPKISLYVSFTVGSICLLINWLTWNGAPWSLVVIGGIVVAWALIGIPLLDETNLNYLLIFQMISLQLYLILIDLIFGNLGWSVNYVYPLLYIVIGIVVAIFVILNRVAWRDYLITLFIMMLLGLTPLLFILFGWVTIYWPSSSAVWFALFLTVGMIIFARKKFSLELKRRLHL